MTSKKVMMVAGRHQETFTAPSAEALCQIDPMSLLGMGGDALIARA